MESGWYYHKKTLLTIKDGSVMVLGFEIAEAQGMTVCRFAYMMSDVTATGPTANCREVPTESVGVEGAVVSIWCERQN